MPLCACFVSVCSQAQSLNETRYYILPGSLTMREWLMSSSRAGAMASAAGGYWAMQSLRISLQSWELSAIYLSDIRLKFAFCLLSLCYSASYPPSFGQRRAAPSQCLSSSNLCCIQRSPAEEGAPVLVCSLVSGGGLTRLSGLAPKTAIVCTVTSSATWGQGSFGDGL